MCRDSCFSYLHTYTPTHIHIQRGKQTDRQAHRHSWCYYYNCLCIKHFQLVDLSKSVWIAKWSADDFVVIPIVFVIDWKRSFIFENRREASLFGFGWKIKRMRFVSRRRCYVEQPLGKSSIRAEGRGVWSDCSRRPTDRWMQCTQATQPEERKKTTLATLLTVARTKCKVSLIGFQLIGLGYSVLRQSAVGSATIRETSKLREK